MGRTSGCSSAWLERLPWEQEVVGSNPATPIKFCLFLVHFTSKKAKAISIIKSGLASRMVRLGVGEPSSVSCRVAPSGEPLSLYSARLKPVAQIPSPLGATRQFTLLGSPTPRRTIRLAKTKTSHSARCDFKDLALHSGLVSFTSSAPPTTLAGSSSTVRRSVLSIRSCLPTPAMLRSRRLLPPGRRGGRCRP